MGYVILFWDPTVISDELKLKERVLFLEMELKKSKAELDYYKNLCGVLKADMGFEDEFEPAPEHQVDDVEALEDEVDAAVGRFSRQSLTDDRFSKVNLYLSLDAYDRDVADEIGYKSKKMVDYVIYKFITADSGKRFTEIDNAELKDYVDMKSPRAVITARQRAIDAGYLVYEGQGTRSPGRYKLGFAMSRDLEELKSKREALGEGFKFKL